jgi:hypothetical protein
MRVPGLTFVSQLPHASERQEDTFDQIHTPAEGMFELTSSFPIPAPRAPYTPFPGYQYPTNPWDFSYLRLPIPSFDDSQLPRSSMMDIPQETNSFKREHVTPEFEASKRQRLDHDMRAASIKPPVNGSAARKQPQKVKSELATSPQSYWAPVPGLSEMDPEELRSLRLQAKRKRKAARKALKKENLSSETSETTSITNNHNQLTVREAQQAMSSVAVTSPGTPEAIAPSTAVYQDPLGNDRHYSISGNGWIQFGIRPSPFKGPSNPTHIRLANAWRSFNQCKVKTFRDFPLLPALIVRHQLLSTLWHFATTQDRIRTFASPRIQGVGIAMFENLLKGLGCTIGSRNKLSTGGNTGGWCFVFSLGWKPKLTSADTIWTFLLEKAAQEKLIDLTQDQADLKKLTEAWLPHQTTGTPEPQRVRITRSAKAAQGKDLHDGRGWDMSKDRDSTPLSMQTKVDVFDPRAGEVILQDIPSTRSIQAPNTKLSTETASNDLETPSWFSTAPPLPWPNTTETPTLNSTTSNDEPPYAQSDVSKSTSVENILRSITPPMVKELPPFLRAKRLAEWGKSVIETKIEGYPTERNSAESAASVHETSAENRSPINTVEIPPEPTPSSPHNVTAAEVRLAELKARILQASLRAPRPIDIQPVIPPPIPKSRLKAADYFEAAEEFEPVRLPSPELIVPPESDYWAMLNYEKRSTKVDLEYLDSFLREGLKS